ncbi:hypothetical protein BSKO_06016 [Bryopsis sp. KO-2023]|nr:hypothetical protein BSKO_06016 [Bryopsis sp. KO-2023]
MGQKLCKQDIPDKFLTPGSVPLEAAEVKRIRKLVIKGKLAPFYPGSDDTGESREHVECPICFLQFLWMNRSLCCGQKICSECFIKIRANSGGSYLGCSCPFCKFPGYTVELCGAKSEDEKNQELLEEQRLVEHRLRQQQEEVCAATTNSARIHAGPEIVSAESDAEESIRAHQVLDEVGEENVPHNDSSLSETSPFPPPTLLVDRGTGCSRDRGTSSTSDGTPSAVIQEEYQQEYSVMSSSMRRSSGAPLSNTEMTQCAEYLGVFPEDLGVRVAEFNELLLEQAIISSMLENRSAQRSPNQDTQDPQSARRPDTPRPGSDGLLDGGPMADRLRWGNMGPSQGGVDSTSDDDRDAFGGGVWRPDTPRPPYSSVPDEQLAESVSRWANDAVDPNWDFVNLIMGPSRPAPDGDGSSSSQVPAWDSAGPVGEGDARESMAAERAIGRTVLDRKFFNSIRRQGSCPARLDGLMHVGERMLSGSSGVEVALPSGELEVQNAVVPRTTSMPHGGSPEYSGMWRHFVARLALSGELDSEATTVHVGMVFLMHGGSPKEEDEEAMEESNGGRPQEPPQSLQVCERVRTDRPADSGGFETVAVTNPDGSLMLVSAQKMEERNDQGEAGISEDEALRTELLALDARVKESIERGDQSGNEIGNSASGSGVGGTLNSGDSAVAASIARKDDDWVRQMQEMDEKLRKALQQ